MISERLRLPTLLLAISGSSFVLGCFAAHSGQPATPSRPPALSSAIPSAAEIAGARPIYLARTSDEAKQYVGDRVCAPCHTALFQQHSATGHARSLNPVTIKDDERLFRNAQTIRDTKTDTAYHPEFRNGESVLVDEGPGGKESLRADIALGSGRNGWTYLGQDHDNQWFILRLSYYTRIHGWDFTPGQEPHITSFTDPKGQPLSLNQVSGCLSCHATSLQMTPDGPDIRHSRLGVGCESCHGPGKTHVDSMSGPGRLFVPMEDLKKATAARIMQICGGCHGTLFDSRMGASDAEASFSRFASTALEQSNCFRGSGQLSCITCHDPHTEVTTNLHAYEAACLRCHSSPQATIQQATRSASSAKLCKVNPRSGCIGCHMPTQTSLSFPHTLFHNHWIKVWTAEPATNR